MTIEVTFENCCVGVDQDGKEFNLGAAHVLRALLDNGHNICVKTEYTDEESHKKVYDWFKQNGIYLIGDNLNTKYIDITIDPKDISAHKLIGYHSVRGKFFDWQTAVGILKVKGLLTIQQEEILYNEIRKELYYA